MSGSASDSGPVPEVGAALGRPGAGELVVLSTAAETDGRLIEVEAICQPGPPGVEERAFVSHEVRFEICDGRLSVGVGGEVTVLRAGQTLQLPAGTPHRIWVEPPSRPARFVWQMRPAPRRPDFIDLVFGGPAVESAVAANQPPTT